MLLAILSFSYTLVYLQAWTYQFTRTDGTRQNYRTLGAAPSDGRTGFWRVWQISETTAMVFVRRCCSSMGSDSDRCSLVLFIRLHGWVMSKVIVGVGLHLFAMLAYAYRLGLGFRFFSVLFFSDRYRIRFLRRATYAYVFLPIWAFLRRAM